MSCTIVMWSMDVISQFTALELIPETCISFAVPRFKEVS